MLKTDILFFSQPKCTYLTSNILIIILLLFILFPWNLTSYLWDRFEKIYKYKKVCQKNLKIKNVLGIFMCYFRWPGDCS